MPKETIKTDPGDEFAVEVQWDRGTHVRVGTIDPAKTADDAGRGLYTELDRSAINRAIAALRRARDSAYGRDE